MKVVRHITFCYLLEMEAKIIHRVLEGISGIDYVKVVTLFSSYADFEVWWNQKSSMGLQV